MIRVRASSVVEAPVAEVWALVGDFAAVADWMPGITTATLDQPGEASQIGTTRRLVFEDGSHMTERLLALSEPDTSVTFAIEESELPIFNYRSTIRLASVTDGDRTYIEWVAEFEVPPAREEAMRRRMLEDIYQPSFDSLKRLFERKGAGDDGAS